MKKIGWAEEGRSERRGGVTWFHGTQTALELQYLHVCECVWAWANVCMRVWILACSSVRVKPVKKGFLEIARHLFNMMETGGWTVICDWEEGRGAFPAPALLYLKGNPSRYASKENTLAPVRELTPPRGSPLFPYQCNRTITAEW